MLEEIAHLYAAHLKLYEPAFSPHKSNLLMYIFLLPMNYLNTLYPT